MIEKSLLSILSTRENFNRFSRFVKESQVEDITWTIIKDLREWYQHTDTVVWSDFSTWFRTTAHPTLKSEKLALFLDIFEAMEDFEPPESEQLILEGLIKRDRMAAIAELAEQGVESGSTDMPDIERIVEGYYKEVKHVSLAETLEFKADIDDLVKHVTEGGLEWRLKPLRNIVKPLRKGDFYVVGSRPNSGKTTFLAAEATYMAPQLPEGKCVVWLNNEEADELVKLRLITAATGIPEDDIVAHPLLAKDLYSKAVGGWERIKLYPDQNHIDLAREILENSSPGLIIIDQLWKMQLGDKGVSEVDRIDELYATARTWAKTIAPVITVHQLGGMAEGVDYPTMQHFYKSQTAIQGHADVVMTIGKVHDPAKEDIRYIWTPKTKRGKSTKIEVTINGEKARYEA